MRAVIVSPFAGGNTLLIIFMAATFGIVMLFLGQNRFAIPFTLPDQAFRLGLADRETLRRKK